jgi:hypothetical protein
LLKTRPDSSSFGSTFSKEAVEMAYCIPFFRISTLSILVLILMLSGSAAAHSQGLTIDITDPSVFAAATSNPNKIGFNGILPAGASYASFNPLTVSGVNFSTPLANTFVDVAIATYYSPNDYSADFSIDSVIAGTNNIPNINNELDIALPQPVHALALDYGGLGFSGVGTAVITLSNGHSFTNSSLPTVGQTTFTGFISTDPITSVKIVTLNDSWVVTDLTLASAGAPQGCNALITPTGQTVSAAGSLGSFGVVTGANCPVLSATTNASWISLLPGPFVCPGSATCPAPPTNIGTVQFAVTANSGAPRTGTVSVGNSTFTLGQTAPGTTCTYGVIPDRIVLGASGGTATLGVIASLGSACQWSATSSSSWLSISPTSGSWSQVVSLRAPTNPTGAQRTAAIGIGPISVPVTQSSASSTGAGSNFCGAVDLTSQFSFHTTGLSSVPFGNWNEYSENISITNNGPAVALPVFIVLMGEPTHFGYPDNSALYGGGAVTLCFSAGDYLVLPSPQGIGSIATSMPTGLTASAPLLWVKQSAAAPIRYIPHVISGIPNK